MSEAPDDPTRRGLAIAKCESHYRKMRHTRRYRELVDPAQAQIAEALEELVSGRGLSMDEAIVLLAEGLALWVAGSSLRVSGATVNPAGLIVPGRPGGLPSLPSIELFRKHRDVYEALVLVAFQTMLMQAEPPLDSETGAPRGRPS